MPSVARSTICRRVLTDQMRPSNRSSVTPRQRRNGSHSGATGPPGSRTRIATASSSSSDPNAPSSTRSVNPVSAREERPPNGSAASTRGMIVEEQHRQAQGADDGDGHHDGEADTERARGHPDRLRFGHEVEEDEHDDRGREVGHEERQERHPERDGRRRRQHGEREEAGGAELAGHAPGGETDEQQDAHEPRERVEQRLREPREVGRRDQRERDRRELVAQGRQPRARPQHVVQPPGHGERPEEGHEREGAEEVGRRPARGRRARRPRRPTGGTRGRAASSAEVHGDRRARAAGPVSAARPRPRTTRAR